MQGDSSLEEAETSPSTKAELVERIVGGRTALEQTLGRLSEAQLIEQDAETGWAIKDHLAHIATWEMGIVALLRHQPRWPAMGLEVATIEGLEADQVNERVYQQQKDRPLTEVLNDFRRAHQAMLDILVRLNDADLLKTYSFYQPDEPGEDSGDPIIGWVIGNTYEHDAEHKHWIEERLAR